MQKERLIRLADPMISEEAIARIGAVLRSGNLVQGKNVADFENILAHYLGVEQVILVSSGTSALHLALVALGVSQGDEVLVPAFTFPAPANVVSLVGATPVLVDISLSDYCLDPQQIEARISPRTKAIIPVHEFGQPVLWNALSEIANRYGIPIIEDAACALGAEFEGKKVGTLGVCGCFSLHPRKIITSGEGGFVVTKDRELAQRIRALRNHGMISNGEKLDFICAGFNYRLTEFQAVLGNEQFSHLEQMILKREQVALSYDRGLADLKCIKTPQQFKNRRNVYQTYHVLLDNSDRRDRLIKVLQQAGIQSGIGAHALSCLSFFQNCYGYQQDNFPNAFSAYTRGLALPIGCHLGEEDVRYVCEQIRQCLKDAV